jgi:hypothetical protein
MLQVQDFRREAGLRTDYAEHALFFGKSRRSGRFVFGWYRRGYHRGI